MKQEHSCLSLHRQLQNHVHLVHDVQVKGGIYGQCYLFDANVLTAGSSQFAQTENLPYLCHMKEFLKTNRPFLLPFACIFTAIGIVLMLFAKADIHLALNAFHTPFGDTFMRYYTPVGEWVPYVIILLLLFRKTGYSLFMLSSLLGSGLVTQIIKHTIRAPRPSVFFDVASHPDVLPLVEGVRLAINNSFPSGHTTSFFAFFLCLSCIIGTANDFSSTEKRFLSFCCFIMALLGGYSRIYLSQHFLSDVFAGGIIGTVVTALMYKTFSVLSERHPHFYNWHIPLPTCKNR